MPALTGPSAAHDVVMGGGGGQEDGGAGGLTRSDTSWRGSSVSGPAGDVVTGGGGVRGPHPVRHVVEGQLGERARRPARLQAPVRQPVAGELAVQGVVGRRLPAHLYRGGRTVPGVRHPWRRARTCRPGDLNSDSLSDRDSVSYSGAPNHCFTRTAFA